MTSLVPVSINAWQEEKYPESPMSVSVLKRHTAWLLLFILFLISGSICPAPVLAADDRLYQEVDALGIRLGMTLAEASALVAAKGGEVKWPINPSSAPTGRFPKWKWYFEYAASLTPAEQKPMPAPRGFPRTEDVVVPNGNSFRVRLHVYPRTAGHAADPDNLVIYAISVVNGSDVRLEDFLDHLAGKYGPVREISAGGMSNEFAFLPDVKTGASYSAADVMSNRFRKGDLGKKSCWSLGDMVLATTSAPFGASAGRMKNGLFGMIERAPGFGPEAYAAWGECGEVTRVSSRIQSANDSRIAAMRLLRYSRDHYESALMAFGECAKRGIAACIGR